MVKELENLLIIVQGAVKDRQKKSTVLVYFYVAGMRSLQNLKQASLNNQISLTTDESVAKVFHRKNTLYTTQI